MKKVIALALVLVMALTVLASCGGGSDSIEGIWKGSFEGENAIIELSKDGKGKIYYSDSDIGSFFMDIEWKTEGNNFTITLEDEEESAEYKLEGDKLTIDGETLTRGSESDIPEDATDIMALAAAFGADE